MILKLLSSGAIIFGITLTVCLDTCFASSIRYTWSGRIYNNPEFIDDPWEIGYSGQSATVKLTVEANALESTPDDLTQACFQTTSVNVLFGNQLKPITVASQLLKFHDLGDGSRFPRIDLISTNLSIAFNGYSQDVALGIVVRGDLFNLLGETAPPPRFDSLWLREGLIVYPTGIHYYFANADYSRLTAIEVPEPSCKIIVIIVVLLAWPRITASYRR
jgi:hypothetical protein